MKAVPEIRLENTAQLSEVSQALEEHMQSLKVRRDALVSERGECEIITQLTERMVVSREAWNNVRRAF